MNNKETKIELLRTEEELKQLEQEMIMEAVEGLKSLFTKDELEMMELKYNEMLKEKNKA